MKDLPNLQELRTMLPHEPHPYSGYGVVCLQGAFLPRLISTTKQRLEKSQLGRDKKSDDYSRTEKILQSLDEQIFTKVLSSMQTFLTDNLCSEDTVQIIPLAAKYVVLQDNMTKCYMVFDTFQKALGVAMHIRKIGITPNNSLCNYNIPALDIDDVEGLQLLENAGMPYSVKNFQATLLTQQPLPTEIEHWPRVSPPKFRRLIVPPMSSSGGFGNHEKIKEEIQHQRETTRFLFLNGLGSAVFSKYTNWLQQQDQLPDRSNSSGGYELQIFMNRVRGMLSKYDASGSGVELWMPQNKSHCYIGMRSNTDAAKALSEMQGKCVLISPDDILMENARDRKSSGDVFASDRLFLDWADITYRSVQKGRRPEKVNGKELKSGEPSRSECTTFTENVVVPGLVVIPNYLTEEMESILVATVTGPTASWFQEQERPSGGKVTRRVQHYGYVFDYASADVLRDRTADEACCPPLPAVPSSVDSQLKRSNKIYTNKSLFDCNGDDISNFINDAVFKKQGWEVFAGIIERTRRFEFPIVPGEDDPAKPGVSYPHLNQLTINEYTPGQGIGSHVDTPSAFSDGLISLSLNSDVVMEFRRVGGTKSIDRKLVHLPRRSLVLMSGPARYEWEHMIVGRVTDTVNGVVLPRGRRVSLTLRTAITAPTSPEVPPLPLTRYESFIFPPKAHNSSEDDIGGFNDLVTPACERKNVHAVYDAIAEQWHHTRGKRGILWPKATDFIESLPRGSIVADVGCGDGKYFAAGWKAGAFVFGTDISEPLLRTSLGGTDGGKDLRQVAYDESGASARPAIAVADCLNLPIKTESCGKVNCVW